jgi:DNA gyrase subunit B
VSYDASAITVLEGLDAVRKRPGMYIGSTGERGLHHLVYEVVDNSVDEALAGYCDSIEVTILADGGVRVIDNGRGIPIDLHPIEGRPAVEVVMTQLHAGGKFGGSGYSVSGGLHGVGISVVNALSRRVDVEVHREGRVWRQSYERGVPVADLVAGEATDHTGTTVTFWSDPEIFETTHYETTTLTRRFQEMAFLNRGLTLSLTDERPIEVPEAEADETETPQRYFKYCYDGGISDFVRHLNVSKGAANPTIIHFGSEESDRHISAEIALQWNNGYSESVYTFANTINTHEGGTHEEGFRSALTTLVNKFAREWGILRDKDVNLSGEDVREGLTAIVSVKLAEPQFEGQTKTKLGNTEAKTYVQKVCNEQLGAWFELRRRYRSTRCPEGPRPCAQSQRVARRRWTTGKAAGLLLEQSRGVRGLRGRGRLSRWFGAAGTRSPHPSDPSHPREDPQRRKGPHRPRTAEQRGTSLDLGAGHRGSRRLRHGEVAVSQDRPDGGRRR